MKIKCLMGLHKPVKDYSDWRNGYHVSACSACGTEMTRSRGGEWRAAKYRPR